MNANGHLARVLLVHNEYQFSGGEDSVFQDEVNLLRSRGHEVQVYSRSNHEIGSTPKLRVAASTIWSSKTANDFRSVTSSFKPDVVHAHNTFPLISPSLYWAAQAQSIPVIQTLHNFRLLCAQGTLNKGGSTCEKCLGTLPWRAVAHGCYRGSRTQSAALVAMLGVHRAIGSYKNKVTRYIALNEFCRDLFVNGGLPAEKISVKGNFVDLPPPANNSRDGFLYIGRLSPEKGVASLAKAWNDPQEMPPLKVAGDGPMKSVFNDSTGIDLLGKQAPAKIYDLMTRSVALILPSVAYESFPRALIEAYACGLPVIASRLGPLKNLVEEGKTGLLFDPAAPQDLRRAVLWANQNRDVMEIMGANARQAYEKKYTANENYRTLISIYSQAISETNK